MNNNTPQITREELNLLSQYPFHIKTQYLKDLSFENPFGTELMVQGRGELPNFEVGVNISAKPLKDNHFEVLLQLQAEANIKEMKAFIVELSYASIVHCENVPEHYLKPLLLIEGGQYLFPFARAIIGQATLQGGYPPLLLQPIDFVSLYLSQTQGQEVASIHQEPKQAHQ